MRKLLFCLLGLVAMLALVVGTTQADEPAKASDLHGAAPTDQQLKALDNLKLSWKSNPRNVDSKIWEASIPKDNQLTEARIALGRELYFETALSKDGTVSCATCHDVTRSFTDRLATSEGIAKQIGKRNAPTTMNAALLHVQFLDGRNKTLEEQAGQPILNPVEMGMPDKESALASIRKDPKYKKMFQDAYGRDINYADLERAIAAFERTLVFLDAPFDRFLAGDNKAIPADAKKGWELFNGEARCVACHPLSASNPLGTDNRFHNIGVSARTQNFEELAKRALKEMAADSSEKKLDELAVGTDLSELGRFMVTHSYADIGSFRTLQLRNIGITGPYMHDGSMETLWDVMDHYNRGGEANPYLDGGMDQLALSEDQISQVVTFLFTLTDERFAKLNQEEFSRQQKQAQTKRPFRDDDLAHREVMLFEKRVGKGGAQ